MLNPHFPIGTQNLCAKKSLTHCQAPLSREKISHATAKAHRSREDTMIKVLNANDVSLVKYLDMYGKEMVVTAISANVHMMTLKIFC